MSNPNVEVNTFNHVAEDIIVVNHQGFQSNIDDFHNYHGWNTNSNISQNKQPKQLWELSDIKFIVLHETSADAGTGFNPPNTAHSSYWGMVEFASLTT